MLHDEQEYTGSPNDLTLRAKALENLLVVKGLVDPAALDMIIQFHEHKIGPQNGAKVVARTWVDPKFLTVIKVDCSAGISREFEYKGDRVNIF